MYNLNCTFTNKKNLESCLHPHNVIKDTIDTPQLVAPGFTDEKATQKTARLGYYVYWSPKALHRLAKRVALISSGLCPFSCEHISLGTFNRGFEVWAVV